MSACIHTMLEEDHRLEIMIIQNRVLGARAL